MKLTQRTLVLLMVKVGLFVEEDCLSPLKQGKHSVLFIPLNACRKMAGTSGVKCIQNLGKKRKKALDL